MKLKKFTIFVLLFALALPAAMAQMKKVSGGVGYYLPGVQFFAPKDLNSHFPSGYPDMKFGLVTHSGSGYGIRKNIVYGGEGGSYSNRPFEANDIKVELDGSFAGVQLGYVVLAKKRLIVYPLVGYMWNTLTYYVHGSDQDQSFTTITENPNQATTLTYETSNLNISLNASYILKGEMSDNGGGGLLLGLQVGYQLPAFNHEWTYDNGNLNGGPEFTMSGFYVRLMIGGGGFGF